MKSVYTFMLSALIVIIFFQGMLIVFDNADKTNLDPDSQVLYDTLLNKTDSVDAITVTNFSRDNPQLSDENAFSVEFFTATTSNQNKITNLDAVKSFPELITFTVGADDDFGWFYDYVYWFIGFIIVLIGFVIIFRREVF